jgi:hypothetical protein
MNKSIGNNYCLAHLPGCHQGHSCQQGLCSPATRDDPSSQLEVKLAASFQERPWQQAFQLLDYPETSDRQPSVLMEACMTCCRLFLSLFLNSSRLSPSPLRGAHRRGRLLSDYCTSAFAAMLIQPLWQGWPGLQPGLAVHFQAPCDWTKNRLAAGGSNSMPSYMTLRQSEDFLEDTGVTVGVLPHRGRRHFILFFRGSG